MSPRQTAGAGVMAGRGRPCPICGIRYDGAIQGWNCIHNVYAASSWAEKRIAMELQIAKKREAEDREDAEHRAGYGPPIVGEGGKVPQQADPPVIAEAPSPAPMSPDPNGLAVAGDAAQQGDDQRDSSRYPASGDPCLHGFDSWLDCPGCTWEADRDNG